MKAKFFLAPMLAVTSLGRAEPSHDKGGDAQMIPHVVDLKPSMPNQCEAKPAKKAPSNDEFFTNAKRGIDALSAVPILGKLFTDYADILRPAAYEKVVAGDLGSSMGGKVAQSNAGLDSYFNDLLQKDPKFRKELVHFIEDLDDIDDHFNRDHKQDPAINEKTPEGLPEGWLWKIALEDAHNDPLTALRLMGALARASGFKFPVPVFTKQTDSLFYFPKALGGDVDIDSQLKAKIISLAIAAKDDNLKVAKTMGDKKRYSAFLAGKSYHIITAALVSCEMLARGHSPEVVKTGEEALAWAYRASTVDTYYCLDLSKPPHNAKERIDQDAAVLLKQWTLGGDQIGIGPLKFKVPHTDFEISVPKWLDENPDWNKIQMPAGWTRERYERAKRRFESVMTDWEWTIAQHKVGAEFAIKHCAKK